ncbi:MAG: FAD-dependent oxidoreductase [Myxococcota bacterium]
MKVDVAIVGGGLSGLGVAMGLHERGGDLLVLEARPRLGGRMLAIEGPRGGRFDLGPAWLWPHQTRLRALANRFGIATFDQHVHGTTVFENPQGVVRRDLTLAPMAGSWRLDGGYGRLIDAVASTLDPARIWIDALVERVRQHGDRVALDLADGRSVNARRVVFALPPRLVAALPFEPSLSPEFKTALSGVATWMAASAKAMAFYETPFWRTKGLSGEAISHRGPLVEIHDASTHDGVGAALFGFLGIPPAARRTHAADLPAAVLAQLSSLFGPEAAQALDVVVMDWATEPLTSTPRDVSEASRPGHPTVGVLPSPGSNWDDRIGLAGAECGADEPGYAEGALQAAEVALERLN